jgi:HAD superfamily hydrolase (TIGR01509 family)
MAEGKSLQKDAGVFNDQRPVKGHLIFGLNGTLVDSEWEMASHAAYLARGAHFPISKKTVFSAYTGLLPAQQFAEIGAFYGVCVQKNTLNHLCAEYTQIKTDLYKQGLVPVSANLVNILKNLRTEGWTLSLCSNTPTDLAARALAVTGLAPLFEHRIYGPDSVDGRAKPDPAMIELAMRVQGCTPENTIFIGDTGADIVAAKSLMIAGRPAKIPMIVYLDPRYKGEDADDRAEAMLKAGARRVILSMDDLRGAIGPALGIAKPKVSLKNPPAASPSP